MTFNRKFKKTAGMSQDSPPPPNNLGCLEYSQKYAKLFRIAESQTRTQKISNIGPVLSLCWPTVAVTTLTQQKMIECVSGA